MRCVSMHMTMHRTAHEPCTAHTPAHLMQHDNTHVHTRDVHCHAAHMGMAVKHACDHARASVRDIYRVLGMVTECNPSTRNAAPAVHVRAWLMCCACVCVCVCVCHCYHCVCAHKLVLLCECFFVCVCMCCVCVCFACVCTRQTAAATRGVAMGRLNMHAYAMWMSHERAHHHGVAQRQRQHSIVLHMLIVFSHRRSTALDSTATNTTHTATDTHSSQEKNTDVNAVLHHSAS